MKFPLETVKGNVREFNPMMKAETSDKVFALTANKVTFSPVSTRMDLTVDYPPKWMKMTHGHGLTSL